MEKLQAIKDEIARVKEEAILYAREASSRPELGASFLYQLVARLETIEEKLKVEDEVPVQGLLSPRELEVITLAAKGQPTKEIAYLLDISMRTVQFHMSSIFKKLEVSSRTEAVARALQLKIIQ